MICECHGNHKGVVERGRVCLDSDIVRATWRARGRGEGNREERRDGRGEKGKREERRERKGREGRGEGGKGVK